VARRLEYSRISLEDIDSVIEHFQQVAVSIESCIPLVVFQAKNIDHNQWPHSCPRVDKALKTAKSSLSELWEYRFINEQSGTEFYVRLVGGKWLDGQTEKFYIREFHLLFD
jgi:hypothetical protein